MTTEFDFNINNYTISDIENFFGLNPDYTFNDVLQKKEGIFDRKTVRKWRSDGR
jgi:hypothetical protein